MTNNSESRIGDSQPHSEDIHVINILFQEKLANSCLLTNGYQPQFMLKAQETKKPQLEQEALKAREGQMA